MAAVSELLRSTFDSARTRLAGFEKTLAKLEKKAQSSIGDIQARFDDAPKRLEGAWTGFTERVKPVFPFATRDELRVLAERMDELSAKIDKLAHSRSKTNRNVA